MPYPLEEIISLSVMGVGTQVYSKILKQLIFSVVIVTYEAKKSEKGASFARVFAIAGEEDARKA